MKLYELPRQSWFRIADNTDAGPFKLDHIDGMYSLCWYNEEICHIAAAEEVIPVNGPTAD